jgi:phenylacetic acid degradation protein paaN
LFQKHHTLLMAALAANRARGFWSAYSEMPRSYSEKAPPDGKTQFETILGKPFALGQDAPAGFTGAETSPFGLPIGVTYPKGQAPGLVAAAKGAAPAWRTMPIDARVGIALEILARLNDASFVMAHATQHTTGQAFAMAFQAGGPHAQDRGLEAVAFAYEEMTRVPALVSWDKPVGRNSIHLEKQFLIVPRGIGLVIGCATFPTWNSYPAIFANLVTGNTVIVKPHPATILPLALTVKIAREVFAEEGLNPNILQLAVDSVEEPLAKNLAMDPAISMVDFTGSSAFGGWLRENLRGKLLFTEEAGINTIVIDSTRTFQSMCQNIAFSLSLYSGQMCTAPQAIFIPRTGIQTDEGHKSFDEVVAAIVAAIDLLLGEPERAAAVLGAIQNPATLQRIKEARGLGRVVRESEALGLKGVRTASPLLIAVDANQENAYLEERFGPISFVVSAADSTDAIARATEAAKCKGAITAALYTSDQAIAAKAAEAYAMAGVALSINLIGNIYMNQSAAFSDFHVSGANPAGNACLTDTAFVANRFRVICIRQPITC